MEMPLLYLLKRRTTRAIYNVFERNCATTEKMLDWSLGICILKSDHLYLVSYVVAVIDC